MQGRTDRIMLGLLLWPLYFADYVERMPEDHTRIRKVCVGSFMLTWYILFVYLVHDIITLLT